MTALYCTKKYYRYTITDLFGFANFVEKSIYDNPAVFACPTVTKNDYIALKEAYFTAQADYDTYGATKKTECMHRKSDLLMALDRLGYYVSELAMGDASMLILSGFPVNKSTKIRQAVPEKILRFEVKRTGIPGEFIIEIPQLKDSRQLHYHVICSEGKPLDPAFWRNGMLQMNATDQKVFYDFSKSRKKYFYGLTLGTVYYFYVFAVNTNGASPISAPKSMVAY